MRRSSSRALLPILTCFTLQKEAAPTKAEEKKADSDSDSSVRAVCSVFNVTSS